MKKINPEEVKMIKDAQELYDKHGNVVVKRRPIKIIINNPALTLDIETTKEYFSPMYGLRDTLRDNGIRGVFGLDIASDFESAKHENTATAFRCDNHQTLGFTIDLSANYQDLPRFGHFPNQMEDAAGALQSLDLAAYPRCWVIQHEVIAQLITSLEEDIKFRIEMAKEFDDDAPSHRIDWAKENIEYLKEASQYSEFIFRPNMAWDDGVFDLMEDSECKHGIKECIFIE